jgi:NAD(P)H-quinone oxidoreductase subunit 5
MTLFPPLSFLAPLVLLAVALLAITRPHRRPKALPALAEGAAALTLGLAVLAVVQLLAFGPQVASLGSGPLTLSLRLDAISVTTVTLVAFVGWIVVRYSRRYLDGEAREGAFHGLMLAALAAVLVLVQSGSLGVMVLAFGAVGLVLRQLLLFYPERAEARRAAAKFSLVWGAGDAALLCAAILLWVAIGTTDVAALGQAAQARLAQDDLPLSASFAVALLVLAAALKTAAFPLHGWLTEVMEAPTPVSALLHAGIINAGGFLLIRLANMVQTSAGAMAALVMLGGFTALFGAAVMLTQSAVKTALAWSTVAQMGFLLLQCGLGLWALALLHIVAHSLYKAHAFLSAGGAVQAVAAVRRPGPVAVPDFAAVARAFALALALGVILIFGVAYLVAQGLADAAPRALTQRTALASLTAAVAYFGFQVIAGALWGPYLPAAPVPGALEWALVVLALMSFGLVAVAQALFPLWAHHPATAALRVHLANGLYLNALLDRMIGGFSAAPKS